MRLRISARKSDLARLQAYMVGDALKKVHPQLDVDYKFKESLGDKNLTDPLWKIPEKGVFTEDFYGELIRGETDLVVHSWKDLPTELKEETVIAASLPRADQRDLLLVKKSDFAKIRLEKKIKVYSSSPRREYNLTPFFKTHLPFSLESVQFENVRGNIPTRLRKLLESEDVQGLIVAKAALDRLLTAPAEEFKEVQKTLRSYLDQLQWMVLPLNINPNAAAQGALAVEILASRQDLKDILAPIHDSSAFECALKERALLASFGGGCHQKIGVTVLNRPYGQITYLRGLSDQGQILETRHLEHSRQITRFPESEMTVPEFQLQRKALPSVSLPKNINAVYVARSEAWIDSASSASFIWTAGIKTWGNLAQKGIWVHGSSEGLGEQEDPQIAILAGRPLNWAKLSHADGYEHAEAGWPCISVYELKIQSENSNWKNKKSYFWSSGSQFLYAAEQDSSLKEKHHACGPGNTARVIRNYLEQRHAFDPLRFQIFLDQDDWRQQCKI